MTYPASCTDYHELPGRCHALLGQPTWPADAELAMAWLAPPWRGPGGQKGG